MWFSSSHMQNNDKYVCKYGNIDKCVDIPV